MKRFQNQDGSGEAFRGMTGGGKLHPEVGLHHDDHDDQNDDESDSNNDDYGDKIA